MRLSRSLPLVLGLAAPALLAAQATTPLDRRIDSVFAAFSRTTTPGCAVAVDRDGLPLVRRAYGMASLETPVPFTVGTISESGSTAKQFVAAAILLLVLDGKLALDDDITRWVPEAKGFGKRITLRHVLSHTSGIPDRYLLHEIDGRPAGEVNHGNPEVISIVARLRDLNFDPGEDYEYSNTGYVIAATVVERASGMSLQRFTDERIFKPLGMTQTRWREDPRALVPGRAAAYAGNATTGFVNDHPFTRVIGSGGLNITVDDFMRWSGAAQRDTGPWAAIRDSMTAVIKLNDGTAITYGLGVSSDTWRGTWRISHTGSTGGYRAALNSYPTQRVSVGLLCNSGAANPGGLATAVSTIVLGDALAPVPTAEIAPAIAVPAELLAARAGRYHSPRTEEFAVLEVRDGALAYRAPGAALIPYGGDRFKVRGQPVELRFTGEGASSRFVRTQPGVRANEFVRVEAPDTTAAALAALAGTYRSPELGSAFTLDVRDGRLVLDRGWRGAAPLAPLYRDGFGLPGGEIVRFTRDPRGRVTGFVIWAGRVRHLRFDRVTGR